MLSARRTTARRRGSCGSRCCSRTRSGCGQTAERSLLQLDALDAIDQLQAVVKRFPPAAGEPLLVAGLVRRGVLRGIPAGSDRARRSRSIRRRARVTVSRASPLFSRCPICRHGDRRHDRRHAGARRLWLSSAWRSAAFSTSASTVCRGTGRSFSRRSSCPHCGYVLRWYRQHSGRQLRRCSADAAATCRAPISIRYPIVETR